MTNPKGTIYSIKRFMVRRHSEVQAEEKMVPTRLSAGPTTSSSAGQRQGVHPAGNLGLHPPQTEGGRREPPRAQGRKAVITVPAYFNDSQRQATKDAGQIAGLEVARIINEPTAAALAYGLDKKKNEQIAVFDLGGGTFDISILDVGDGVFEVLSTNGDTHLGGDDWDEALINYIADEFKKEQDVDLRKDQMALQRLKEAAEKAKKDLSFQAQADINLPFITADQNGPKHLTMTITRSQFEPLTDHLFERLRGPVKKALEDAKLKARTSTRWCWSAARPDAPGPADRQGDFRQGAAQGGQSRRGRGCRRGHPGAVLAGDVKGVLLLDVTPLSLGLETKGGVFTKLVERNTTIPTEKKETFTTADDNQTAVTIKVFQGERPMAADNRLLGEFNLEGIPPAPMGVPQIEVSFTIDANGILQVSAKDKGTGKEQTIKIESSGGLTKEEIDRMQRDAQAHAAEDKRRRELAEARNAAEQRVYQLEKLMNEKRIACRRQTPRPFAGHRQGQPGESGGRPCRDSASDRGPPAGKPGNVRTPLRRVRRIRKPRGSNRLGPSGDGDTRGGQEDEVIDVEFQEQR